jgi:HD-like signal output (HDOD) protein/CheY-like chemotaxis protein
MGQDDSQAETSRRPRILFVDDEPLVLRSLQRVLASRAAEWDVEFAEGARAALESVAQKPPDVVVSDMRMPEMDGATFLAKIQEHHPEVVRIILSGHTDAKVVFRAVPVAHQFLTKPLQTSVLVATLERALEFRRALGSPRLRAIVAGDNRLPTAPAVYAELTSLLSEEDCSLADIVGLIERRPALAARVAQLAASSFFSVPRTVSGLSGYVTYLGVDIIKTLVLTVELVEMFDPRRSRIPGFSLEAAEEHAITTAHIARRIVGRQDWAESAFLGGVLHDIGELILASRMPREYGEAHERSRAEKIPLIVLEKDIVGATHAEIGAYLLALWGLPIEIVRSVLMHHATPQTGSGLLGVEAAVYLANLLARNPEVPIAEEDGAVGISPSFIDGLSRTPDVEEWRVIARAVLHGARG